jgi:hypothetical protein
MGKTMKYGKSMAAISGIAVLALLGFGALYNQRNGVSANENSFLSRTSSALREVEMVTVPAETRIHIRLDNAISTDKNSAGDRFEASLDGALMANGQVLAPAQSKITGELTEVKRAGRGEEHASFTLALRTLAVDGKEYELHTIPLTRVARSTVKRNGKPVAGDVAAYGPESRLTVTLSQPLKLPIIADLR